MWKSNNNTNNNNFIYPFLMKLGEGKLEYVEKNQSEQGVACQMCTQSTLVVSHTTASSLLCIVNKTL